MTKALLIKPEIQRVLLIQVDGAEHVRAILDIEGPQFIQVVVSKIDAAIPLPGRDSLWAASQVWPFVQSRDAWTMKGIAAKMFGRALITGQEGWLDDCHSTIDQIKKRVMFERR